jgi:hypothetical protein
LNRKIASTPLLQSARPVGDQRISEDLPGLVLHAINKVAVVPEFPQSRQEPFLRFSQAALQQCLQVHLSTHS